jgi:hypothetical protein
MELKRIMAEGKLKGVKVIHAGPKQKFSPSSLLDGMSQGWLTMADGVITVRNADGADVQYRVVRTPGYYCCHCGEKLPGDPAVIDGPEGAAVRKKHVEDSHRGKKSPDPENPSGYMGTNSFKGVLISGKGEKATPSPKSKRKVRRSK